MYDSNNISVSPTEIDQKILDSFGRKHEYLRISLTERCNLRCTYCMPEQGIQLRDKSHFMRNEEVFEMASIFVGLGIKKIRLTGGEPLVRKGVDNIITDLGGLNTELTISTNGILVDQFIDNFKKAGIKSVNVSLDSLKPGRQELITRRNYYDRIRRNIDLLLEEGFAVKINIVVMKNINDDELIDFIELSKDKPLHIRFIEFMPFNGNNWSWDKGIGLAEMMNTFSDRYGVESILKIQEEANSTAKCFAIDGYAGTFGIISSVTNPFCSTCNRIRVTADGKMKNCLFSSEETDLLNPLRRGENIIPLILQGISNKKAIRAGMESFDDLSNPTNFEKNRNMITIGG